MLSEHSDSSSQQSVKTLAGAFEDATTSEIWEQPFIMQQTTPFTCSFSHPCLLTYLIFWQHSLSVRCFSAFHCQLSDVARFWKLSLFATKIWHISRAALIFFFFKRHKGYNNCDGLSVLKFLLSLSWFSGWIDGHHGLQRNSKIK